MVQLTNQWARFGELSEKMQNKSASMAEMQELAQLRGVLLGSAKSNDKALKDAGVKISKGGESDRLAGICNRLAYQHIGANEYRRRQMIKELQRYNKIAHDNSLPTIPVSRDTSVEDVDALCQQLYTLVAENKLRGEWNGIVSNALAEGEDRAARNWPVDKDKDE